MYKQAELIDIAVELMMLKDDLTSTEALRMAWIIGTPFFDVLRGVENPGQRAVVYSHQLTPNVS